MTFHHISLNFVSGTELRESLLGCSRIVRVTFSEEAGYHVCYSAPLGGPSRRRSSAENNLREITFGISPV